MSSLQTKAQNRIGLRSGINWSQKRYLHTSIQKDIIGEQVPFVMGWNIGIPLEFRLSKHFALQPEATLVSKSFQTNGQTFSIAPPHENISYYLLTVRRTSLEVPILLKYYISNSSRGLYILAGPSLEWFLRQKDQYLTFPIPPGDNIYQVFKTSNIFDRFKIGYGFGLGFTEQLGTTPIFGEIRYQTSWIDPSRQHRYDSNTSFTVSIGVMLPTL
ncbi:hypothetical protein GCM10023189_23990 [Nibrella saemangeumensis]|uniref:Outer membrane protein beta-barrel domain-containing protein n=2 Tax=Nibrella saemangeumensis TaxID=1084526 RepID=A0ABP8MTC7_9BACT